MELAAVLLTLGEPTTERALASLRGQSLPVEELVVVEGTRPFYRALNEGAGRVRAPLFVQLDADMVLDPGCLQTLRAAMEPGVGLAVGALRDPLMDGPVSGVKLFRSECFRARGLRDTLAPEVEFYRGLERLGWRARWVLDPRSERFPVLGDHDPAGGRDYVYGTYSLLGRRYGLSRDAARFGWRLDSLRRSPHPLAPVARLAICQGVFDEGARDVEKPVPAPEGSGFLRDLLATEPAEVAGEQLRRLLGLEAEELFESFHQLGALQRATGSPAELLGFLRSLGGIGGPCSLLAEIALARGAMAPALPAGPEAALGVVEMAAAPSGPLRAGA